jgi:YjbE family integral membrane protein
MDWLSTLSAEVFTSQFAFALLSIVLIDIVLAGDNAIVIALAARNLPPALQKKAVFWGTFGAIAIRTLMTVVVVWLLKIPGLLLIGGVALLWIAYRLLTAEDGGEESHVGQASFWAAIKTIVIADAVMGVDNVLAVAGAANGSFLLVVLGLLISVPVMVWGSRLVLKLMERYGFIVYIGAAVLVVTAAKMALGEQLLAEWVEANTWINWVVYPVALIGVLGAAWLVRRSAEARRQKVAGALPLGAE